MQWFWGANSFFVFLFIKKNTLKYVHFYGSIDVCAFWIIMSVTNVFILHQKPMDESKKKKNYILCTWRKGATDEFNFKSFKKKDGFIGRNFAYVRWLYSRQPIATMYKNHSMTSCFDCFNTVALCAVCSSIEA